MKPLQHFHRGGWTGKTVPFAIRLIIVAAMALHAGGVVRAGGTVTSCTEANLRAAMAGGGTVNFTCDGTITLTSTITNSVDTVLDGSGHQITICNSNNYYNRIFFVNSNVTFTVINLAIAKGYSDNGAGIFNAGGYLTVRNCLFLSNSVRGYHGNSNSGNPGTNACGGAIFNAGTAFIASSIFSTNSAFGGYGGSGTNGGTTGGSGGTGGSGYGGAICNFGDLTLSNSSFSGNLVAGDVGGTGGVGGGGVSPTWTGGTGGAGGAGGCGYGGALFNGGVARLVNTTIASNSSVGGQGGTGGNGGSSLYGGNGGNGNNGGAGIGGGIYDFTGHCSLTNVTIALNSTFPGAAGAAGLGVYGTYGSGSSGLPRSPGSASGGGVGTTNGTFLINVLVALNTPTNGSLGIVDGGHNLSSDSSCGFTNGGSLNNANPLLGPLMDNGGSTFTMALLPGSPAIDAGDNLAAPPTDQRGVPRPAGPTCDIGAYECGPPEIIVPPQSQGVLVASTADFSATVIGYPPLKLQWFFNQTNILGGATNALLELTNVQIFQSGTYYLVVTNSFGSVTSTPAQLDVFSQIVRNSSEAALRAALALTNTVLFQCDGAILLSSTIAITSNTVLDGSGHQVTISGNNTVGIFYVAPNVNFVLTNLTIANGSSPNGAGIFNDHGQVTVNACRIIGNHAQAASGTGTNSGADGFGGAVYNSGQFTAIDSSFISNSVTGGFGQQDLWLAPEDWFCSPGGAGGNAGGGVIFNSGTLIVSGCSLANNGAIGGLGGVGQSGYFCDLPHITGGHGGAGGNGKGGAILNSGAAMLVNSTLAMNVGTGGRGGAGGNGGGAYDPDYSPSDGGPGGTGGTGAGAIYDVNGQMYVTNCTLALNSGIPGAGGAGGGAGPIGPCGGRPGGYAGAIGSNGPAGVGSQTAGTHFFNTLLLSNVPSNCSGLVSDGGYNMSSDASVAFPASGSRTNINPMLGPLVNNGGPTLTMALLPGSPAIDAGGAIGAPAIDQRGVLRPQGAGMDIGAFEFQYIPVFTTARFQSATNFWLQACGLPPQQTCTLQVSTNLTVWWDLAAQVVGTNGQCEFVHTNCGSGGARFYRLKLPVGGSP